MRNEVLPDQAVVKGEVLRSAQVGLVRTTEDHPEIGPLEEKLVDSRMELRVAHVAEVVDRDERPVADHLRGGDDVRVSPEATVTAVNVEEAHGSAVLLVHRCSAEQGRRSS